MPYCVRIIDTKVEDVSSDYVTDSRGERLDLLF